MISMGTNDFLENYYAIPGGRQSQLSIGRYQDFLVNTAGSFLRELHMLGARKISLGGLPPMGCLPLERTTNVMFQNDCIDSYNDLALEFNGKLKVLTTKLSQELSGVKLVFSNPYYIFMHIIRNPYSYGNGLSNTKDFGNEIDLIIILFNEKIFLGLKIPIKAHKSSTAFKNIHVSWGDSGTEKGPFGGRGLVPYLLRHHCVRSRCYWGRWVMNKSHP